MRTHPEYGYDLGAGTGIDRASPVWAFRTESFGEVHRGGADSSIDESRIEIFPLFSVSGQRTPKGIVFAALILPASSVGSLAGHPMPSREEARSVAGGV